MSCKLFLVMKIRGRLFFDETQRPRRQRQNGLLAVVPLDPLVLDVELLMKTLRSAKQGSAGNHQG